MKPYRGPPMTLGSAAAAKVRLMVWCKACGHRSEPDPADQARWYGPETTVPEWRTRSDGAWLISPFAQLISLASGFSSALFFVGHMSDAAPAARSTRCGRRG